MGAGMNYYFVGYDVSSAKVRYRVVKELNKWGERVQKSLFEIYITQGDLDFLIIQIKKYLDINDSFRIYKKGNYYNNFVGKHEIIYVYKELAVH